jgi:alpha-L-fucosidase
VKTPEQLFELYLKSVGRGGALDLGLSPDTRGLLHENDVRSLEAFGEILQQTFGKNLASNAQGLPLPLTDADRFSAVDGDTFEAGWTAPQRIDLVRLREDIRAGQRISAVEVDAWIDGAWKKIANATSIGPCRILYFPEVTTTKLRVRISETAAPARLSEIGVFKKSTNNQ